MKYRWTFHLVGGKQISIDAEKKPPLEFEWLTLSDREDSENAQIIHMPQVVVIEKKAIK